MKQKGIVLMVAALAIAGCGKEPEIKPVEKVPQKTSGSVSVDKMVQSAPPPPTAAPAPNAVAPAPVTNETAAATGQTAAADAPKLTDYDIQQLNYAVYMFKEQYGHFPKSFQEMIGTPHLAKVPVAGPGQKLTYDPQLGLVKLESK